jgi:hypothetical protein
MRLLDWIHLSDLTTTRAALDDALHTLPGGETIDVDQLTAAFVEKLKERLEA